MTNQKYPHLFSPLDIGGGIVLKNRIIYSSIGLSHFAPGGFATMENLNAYELRARSGAALITHPETIVDLEGDGIGAKYNLCNPGIIPDITKETEMIHRYGGYSTVCLCHHGGRADPLITPSGKIYGPSEVVSPLLVDNIVTPMDEAMIQHTVEAFAEAARMAKFAGYDMVTIHGAHGFLFSQFLSPRYNMRTDQYGGSIENRARIAVEVVDAIRAKCGRDFPIEFRFSGDDFMENGAHIDEMKELAKIMDGKVNILHVSASSFYNLEGGVSRMIPSMFLPHGVNAYLAKEIKSVVTKSKVATVGSLTVDQMEKILANGEADLVAAARAFFADPFWPRKAESGCGDDITPCVRCNVCISGNYVPFVPWPYGLRRCTVNPKIGMEWEQNIQRQPVAKRKVLVIGGGPAGMTAAMTASEMGHEVILCEKSDRLGGAINNFIGPDFKADYKKYLQLQEKRVKNHAIDLRMNTEMTPEMAAEIGADVIIMAIGSKPAIPPIPGVDNPKVITTAALPCEPEGKKIVVIGGGASGAEEAIDWASKGKDVTVIEALGELAGNAPYVHRQSLLLEYKKAGAPKVCLNTKCTRITNEGVWAVGPDGEEKLYEADTVLMAVGLRPLRAEAEAFRGCAKEFRVIGDCFKTRTVFDANKDGYTAAKGLIY